MDFRLLILMIGLIIQNIKELTIKIIKLLNGFGIQLKHLINKNWQDYYIFAQDLLGLLYMDLSKKYLNLENYKVIEEIMLNF